MGSTEPGVVAESAGQSDSPMGSTELGGAESAGQSGSPLGST